MDPPDGKIPPLTPEAARARDAARKLGPNQDYANPNAPVKADSAEDLNLGERCLSFGGPPILPGAYNSNFHIIQNRDNVLIEYEWANEPRIIPLDGSPHVLQVSTRGTVIRADIGRAIRWSWRPPISVLAPPSRELTPKR